VSVPLSAVPEPVGVLGVSAGLLALGRRRKRAAGALTGGLWRVARSAGEGTGGTLCGPRASH
jgi:hypothetical protein